MADAPDPQANVGQLAVRGLLPSTGSLTAQQHPLEDGCSPFLTLRDWLQIQETCQESKESPGWCISVGYHPMHGKVSSSISGHGICPGCRFGPGRGMFRRHQLMRFLSPSPFSLPL